MNTLAERLRYAMNHALPKKVKGVTIARVAGVKPPSVSDWLSGKSQSMGGEKLLKVANFLGVEPMWLASGKGRMLQAPKDSNDENSVALALLIEKLNQLNGEQSLSKELIEHLSSTVDVISKAKNNELKVANGTATESMKKSA